VRDTDDLIEAEGVALSGCEVGESDVVAVILDASTEVLASGFRELVKDSNYLMVFNKSDEGLPGGSYDCVVSARSGDGISGFKDLILESVKDGAVNSEKTYLIRERHLGLFKEALVLLDGCLKNISRESDIDIAAEDLRLVRSLFDEFLGVKYPDSLLGDIFKDFCIGK
jgi:tRNA U34 5-carboxymethylaminomethyl modifying GTPase MnmE/TrmE